MVRYSRRRSNRRRPVRRARRTVPSRSYKEIGLDYLKKIGKAVAYGGAAAAVGGGLTAAYKYRNRFRPAAAQAADAWMGGYNVAEGNVAARAAAGQNYVRGLYDRAKNAWAGYRAVPDYGGQFRDAVRQVGQQGYGGRMDNMPDYEFMMRRGFEANALRQARERVRRGIAPPREPLVPYGFD